MKILKFNKHKESQYQVFIKDLDKPLELYDDTIIHFNLLSKKNVTQKEIDEIIEYNNDLLSYYKALKYIGVKMRTKSEIRKYLKKYDFSNNNINNTILKLDKAGYLDEKQYIKAYVLDQLTLSLNGPLKIKNNLLNLELTEDDINEEIDNIKDEIWLSKVDKIISKRIKSNKDSEINFKLKTAKYLYSIGYPKYLYDDILNNIKIENDNFEKTANNLYHKLQRKYEDDKLYLYLKNKLYAKGYSLEQIDGYINKLK